MTLSQPSKLFSLPALRDRSGWNSGQCILRLSTSVRSIASRSVARSAIQRILVAIACLSFASYTFAITTTFDAGTEGWSVSGRDDISPTGGNPGANMDVDLIDVFGAEIRNDSNLAFLGDYTQLGAPLRLAVDVKIDSISFFGTEVPRDLVVEMVDYNPPGSNYPYVSVYYPLGTLASSLPGWRTFETTIVDPDALALPPGWGGTGDEDPMTFEPRLPPNRTFASVLQSVDEFRFTTFVPGFFFGFTNFEMQVDNPTLAVVPEPATWITLVAAWCSLALARRLGYRFPG
ncbi:MAG TPA: hypothetical protein VIY86_14975 [Pirellulaceae bacterium]